MTVTTWWLRVVGAFYIVVFVAVVFVKAPLDAEGPPGVLARAQSGDATARFVIDTWTTFGLHLGALGVALLVLGVRGARHVTTVIGVAVALEIAGIVADVNKLGRGYPLGSPVTWMAIHTLIIATGIFAIRRARVALRGST